MALQLMARNGLLRRGLADRARVFALPAIVQEVVQGARDEQELAVLSLHLLQSSLVYINTLMLQRVLTEPAWMAGMTTDDLRGLTPLIYTHVNPYGTFSMDLAERLALDPAEEAA